MTSTCKAYGATGFHTKCVPMEIKRRAPRDNDVTIDIEYCGICHSDLHAVTGSRVPEAMKATTKWPLVPGHEIIGKVTAVGPKVSKYKVGDTVGVGCLIDSCGTCDKCKSGFEQFCPAAEPTYAAPDKEFGGRTAGGYSQRILAQENFVLKVAENIYGPAAAPLLCAGITTWAPFKRWNVRKGQKLGVVGMGGLGHMGIKFAKALGCETWIITSSKSKADAAREQGVDGVIFSTDEEDMKKHAGTFDVLYNTIPKAHDINPYVALMACNAVQILVGCTEVLEQVNAGSLVYRNKIIAGSLIGGLPSTQECLDFCAKNNIVCDVEVVGFDKVNEAWDRIGKNDVKYRFVLDNSTL